MMQVVTDITVIEMKRWASIASLCWCVCLYL